MKANKTCFDSRTEKEIRSEEVEMLLDGCFYFHYGYIEKKKMI